MEHLWELLKITLPSLVVLATAYFLLKTLLEARLSAHLIDSKKEGQKVFLPLKLQALERLAMMTERIRIPALLLRLRDPEMRVKDLQLALMLGIQQEIDHNVSQQVYVSDTLWKIVALAKDQAFGFVGQAAESIDPQAPAEELVSRLLAQSAMLDSVIERAQTAIRKEAENFS